MVPTYLLLLFSICGIIHIAVDVIVDAQPGIAQKAVSAFVEGQYFLISGGELSGSVRTRQTFIIDLSVPWKTSSPAYSLLPDGPTFGHAAASLSLDRQTFVVLAETEVSLYNIAAKAWSSRPAVQNYSGTPGAAVGSNNMLYVPGGHSTTSAQGIQTKSMLQYDIATGAYQAVGLNSQSQFIELASLFWTTPVWSEALKKIIVVGGDPRTSAVFAYTPSSNTWESFAFQGTGPGGRINHCAVPAYGGTKIITFGGFDGSGDHSDVYEFDVSNPRLFVWTFLGDRGRDYMRGTPACAIHKDLLIVWGGGSNNQIVSREPVMVFHLKEKRWLDEFVPDPTQSSPPPPPSGKPPGSDSSSPSENGGGSSEGSSGTNVLAVVFGIIAGALVVGIVCAVYIRRRRERHRREEEEEEEGKTQGPRMAMDQTTSNPAASSVSGGTMNRMTMSEMCESPPPEYHRSSAAFELSNVTTGVRSPQLDNRGRRNPEGDQLIPSPPMQDPRHSLNPQTPSSW